MNFSKKILSHKWGKFAFNINNEYHEIQSYYPCAIFYWERISSCSFIFIELQLLFISPQAYSIQNWFYITNISTELNYFHCKNMKMLIKSSLTYIRHKYKLSLLSLRVFTPSQTPCSKFVINSIIIEYNLILTRRL